MSAHISEAAEKEILEYATTVTFSLEAVRYFYATVGRIPTPDDTKAAVYLGLYAIANFYYNVINQTYLR